MGYMYCHYCEAERVPEQLDYSGYCVFCGVKSVQYSDSDGPLAPGPEPVPPPPEVEILNLDGDPMPIDAPRNIRWMRRLTLTQMVGPAGSATTCGSCAYSMAVTENIVSCPISAGRGAATHLDRQTPSCSVYMRRCDQ